MADLSEASSLAVVAAADCGLGEGSTLVPDEPCRAPAAATGSSDARRDGDELIEGRAWARPLMVVVVVSERLADEEGDWDCGACALDVLFESAAAVPVGLAARGRAATIDRLLPPLVLFVCCRRREMRSADADATPTDDELDAAEAVAIVGAVDRAAFVPPAALVFS